MQMWLVYIASLVLPEASLVSQVARRLAYSWLMQTRAQLDTLNMPISILSCLDPGIPFGRRCSEHELWSLAQISKVEACDFFFDFLLLRKDRFLHRLRLEAKNNIGWRCWRCRQRTLKLIAISVAINSFFYVDTLHLYDPFIEDLDTLALQVRPVPWRMDVWTCRTRRSRATKSQE